MNLEEFEELVVKAIEGLPDEFKNKLENIDIVVENQPDMELATKLKLGSKGRLLGLYQGVPLKARTHYYGMVLPDKITLFKDNIERVCRERRVEPFGEIKHVLEHEIAHHFGISDNRLRDLDIY